MTTRKMSIVPNASIDRLRYVLKTYAHEPVVAYETLRFALYAVGLDEWARDFGEAYASRGEWRAIMPVEYVPAEDLEELGERRGRGAVTTGVVQAILDGEPGELLRRVHDADRVLPWHAAQLNKLLKALRRSDGGHDSVSAMQALLKTRDDLQMKGAAIAQWAAANRVDIGRLSAEEVLGAIKDFEVDTGPLPQGIVRYTFPDGWTVQELPPEALEAEGETMQHCVGGYCEKVASGQTIIYSLRDPRGKPHVTMEYDPKAERFTQVYGKQNEKPQEKYAMRVRQFIAEGLDGEPLGMIMAGADPKTLDLTGANLSHADLSGADLSRADLSGAHLSRADLSGADLRDANLTDADLTDANLTGAILTDAILPEGTISRPA